MFRFLKKRKRSQPSPDILGMEDHAFVEAVSRMIRDDSLPAGVMCLVAIANLPSIMAVTYQTARQRPEEKLPTDLDGFIQFLTRSIEMHDGNEIGERRLMWFFLGALILRSGSLAAKDTTLVEPVIDMWLHLAEAGALLADTLSTNKLWEHDEQVWFKHIHNSSDGMSYVVRHMLPKHLHSHRRIREFARSHDV